MSHVRLAAALAVTAAVLGGCIACSAGSPEQRPFPPRTFSIDVSAVAPCSALTDDQRRERNLVIGRPIAPQYGTSRGCAWIDRDGRGVNLQTFDQDATAAVDAEPSAEIVAIAGIGGVQSTPEKGTNGRFCQIVLDVTDGASLRSQIDVSDLSARPTTPEGACAELREVTAQMLGTLRARQAS